VFGSWLKNLWGLVKKLVPKEYPPARADVPFVNVCRQDGIVDGDDSSSTDTTSETEKDTVREILAVHEELNDPAFQSRTEALWRTLVGDEVPHDSARIGVIFPAPEQVTEDFRAYTDFVLGAYAASLASSTSTPGSDGVVDLEEWLIGLRLNEEARRGNVRFSAFAGRKSWPRRFAVTDRGYLALVLDGVEVGDEAVVLDGARTPYAVRRVEAGKGGEGEEDRYELLAEAYLHGFMKGEGVDGGFEECWFHLV
jgi:hypothetical protein